MTAEYLPCLRRRNPDRNYISALILLVPHRQGEAPQQAEGDFILYRGFRGVLLKLPDLVLDVLFIAPADKLQVGDRAFAGGQNYQAADLFSVFFLQVSFQIKRRQGQEHFLGNCAQPLLHRSIPAAAVGEPGDELVEFRQGVYVEPGLKTHTARVGKLQI